MTPAELAERLRLRVRTLERWRVKRYGSLWHQFGALLGLTPASPSRVAAYAEVPSDDAVRKIEIVIVYKGDNGRIYERPLNGDGPATLRDPDAQAIETYQISGDL